MTRKLAHSLNTDSIAAANYSQNEYCILPSVFNEAECAEIISWCRYDIQRNNFWNFTGNPDTHYLLRRVNDSISAIFGKKFTFFHTVVHGSSSSNRRLHDAHIDAVQRFFRYGCNTNVQVWVLLQADNIHSEDALLHLWTGFVPDETKAPKENFHQCLQEHTLSNMQVGDILLMNAWCPHATGVIDHQYSRIAMKIHFYSEDAELDKRFMRSHKSLPWSASFAFTHSGLEPLLFALEKLKGGRARRLLAQPLCLLRGFRMLFNFEGTWLSNLLWKLRNSSNIFFGRKGSGG